MVMAMVMVVVMTVAAGGGGGCGAAVEMLSRLFASALPCIDEEARHRAVPHFYATRDSLLSFS